MPTGRDIAVTLTADSRGFSRGIKSARDDLGGLRSTISSVKTALGGFLAVQSIRGFIGGITETIGKIDDLAATAGQLGVSTEFLSEIQGAAKLSDTEIESLNQGLKLFEKNLSKAAMEGGDVDKILRQTGKSAKELAALGPEEAFLEIADAASRIPDAFDRATFVTSLFGKSGQNLIGILSRGKQGIQDLREEVRRLGGTITADMADKAGLADDSIKRLDIAWQGLKNTLAIELAPTLTDSNGLLVDMVAIIKDSLVPALQTALSFTREFRDDIGEIAFVLEKLMLGASLRDAFKDLQEFAAERDKARALVPSPGSRGTGAPDIDLIGDGGSKQKIEIKNPPQSIFSKEGFSTLVRALRPPSVNVPQQQLAEQKKANTKLDEIKNAVKDIKLPPVAPDF